MANIRRELGWVGKVLKVWGITISIFAILSKGATITAFFDGTPLEILIKGGIIAWAPFLLFKFFSGDGRDDDEEENKEEKPSD